MARKIKTNHRDYSPEQFNRWARELGVSTRFDYSNFENRELVKRIEEAKFAQMNPMVQTPSEKLEGQDTDQGIILSGIKSILNLF